MLIKAIVFDLDDTLIDHKGAETKALIKLRELSSILQTISPETWLNAYRIRNKELWDLYGQGRITREILHFRRFNDSILDAGAEISKEQVQELGRTYMEAYRTFWEWNDGAEKVFRNVMQRFPTGILTNGFKETQRLKLARFGIDERLAHVVISEEFGVMKPDRRIFDEAFSRLETNFRDAGKSLSPEQVLYVGDSYTSDIQGAANAGWRSAWYRPAKEASGRMSESVADRASADLIFNHFDEFEALITDF